jgi:hypothetical protein
MPWTRTVGEATTTPKKNITVNMRLSAIARMAGPSRIAQRQTT